MLEEEIELSQQRYSDVNEEVIELLIYSYNLVEIENQTSNFLNYSLCMPFLLFNLPR